jgi:hypothetical protein
MESNKADFIMLVIFVFIGGSMMLWALGLSGLRITFNEPQHPVTYTNRDYYNLEPCRQVQRIEDNCTKLINELSN